MNALDRKREVNSYLPRVAFAYLRREITFEELLSFFCNYSHLYTLGLDTNAICNLACSYCYLDRYNREKNVEYQPLFKFEQIIREAVCSGVDLIALVGKEPFADDRGINLLTFMHRLREQGHNFRYGVVTNGTLLERYMDRLPRTIAYVDVSLDGLPAINDTLRGEGVYQKATETCRQLVDRGYEVWVSSVVHGQALGSDTTRQFLTDIVNRTGVNKFYFSPVRNFTGNLDALLLSFGEISKVESEIISISERVSGLERIVLDHPYEAVWRDYLVQNMGRMESILDALYVDGYGAVFERLSGRVLRKLDIFPHGPWGTARIDAYGNYLADVEARTYEVPPSVGNIANQTLASLHALALRKQLSPIMRSFLDHMHEASAVPSEGKALTSASIPVSSRVSIKGREQATA